MGEPSNFVLSDFCLRASVIASSDSALNSTVSSMVNRSRVFSDFGQTVLLYGRCMSMPATTFFAHSLLNFRHVQTLGFLPWSIYTDVFASVAATSSRHSSLSIAYFGDHDTQKGQNAAARATVPIARMGRPCARRWSQGCTYTSRYENGAR